MKLNPLKLETRRLVERFLYQRDEASFRKLYRRCTPVLYPLALRMLAGNKSDAEDVIQEAWIRAVQGLPQFRWQSTFETWLYSITVRCCQESIRKRDRDKQSPPLQSEFDQQSAKIESTDLEAAITGLPDGYREVFVLHDIEGYTHREIADFLNIKPGTSKSQLFHARSRVRKILYEDNSA